MSTALPAELRVLIESGPLAYLSTTSVDGSPHVTLIWIGLDDGELISTHMRENVKLRNIARDPRVALSFGPSPVAGDWISPYAVVHATASVQRSDLAGALMSRLASVYVGAEASLPSDGEPGYIVRYAIERITGIGPWVTTRQAESGTA